MDAAQIAHERQTYFLAGVIFSEGNGIDFREALNIALGLLDSGIVTLNEVR